MHKKAFLIGLVVVLLIAGAVLVTQKKKVEPIVTQPSIEDTKEDTNVPEDTTPTLSVDTSDWKTYRSEKHGFEFQYPKDWKIDADSGINSDRSVVSITSPKTFEMIRNSSYCEGCGPDVSFYHYSSILDEPANKLIQAKTLSEFIEKEPFTKKLGTRMVGGMEMVEIVQGGFGSYYVLMIEKNRSIYKIFFTYADTAEKLGDIENKILSTFKIQ